MLGDVFFEACEIEGEKVWIFYIEMCKEATAELCFLTFHLKLEKSDRFRYKEIHKL